MLVVKRINVLSSGKIVGVTYALLGLLFGSISSLTTILGVDASHIPSGMGNEIGAYTGIFSVVVFPVFFGVAGFIAGLLGAVFFNLAARWCGGLLIETQ